IGTDDNALTLFDDDGVHPLLRASKDALARSLIAHIAKLYGSKKKQKNTEPPRRQEQQKTKS
ncbi:MAG TPA: hypothetical protein VFG44_01455, partial [Burkholderiales bacterium]|nr:hypothetical protein [Burkholderiales bacterium]